MGCDQELIASVSRLRDGEARAFENIIGGDDSEVIINAGGFFIIQIYFADDKGYRIFRVPELGMFEANKPEKARPRPFKKAQIIGIINHTGEIRIMLIST